MSIVDTIAAMKQRKAKKPKVETVPIHSRLPQSDLDEVDAAAAEEIASRADMITRIVRQWVKVRRAEREK